MLGRGELSFIFLWVINPVVILFYQNCSSLPVEQANTKVSSATQIVQEYNQQQTHRLPACKLGDCAEPIN